MKMFMVVSVVACSVLLQGATPVNREQRDNAAQGQVHGASCVATSPVDREVCRLLRPLPLQCVIGANLIVDGKWFILDASEVDALEKLLAGSKPYVMPEEFDHVSLRPCSYTVILWGVDKGKVVALDSVNVSYPIDLFNSTAKNCLCCADHLEKEKRLLGQAVKRAATGKQKPIASRIDGKAPGFPMTSSVNLFQ